jgi:NitT/TauT family transport system ATP-binding protein
MDIELIKVSKQFGEKQVIKDFDAVFHDRQISCLMGASGIGKTTLINILMGLVKPDSGEIRGLRGRKIAAVFQEDRLIEHWDAVKNILLVCDKRVTAHEAEQELYKVGLEDFLYKPVSKLSGGMRQRVAIVRALLAQSDLVIMDEPFKGLDDILKKKVIEYVKQKTKGKTVIIVTHDKEDLLLLQGNLITMESALSNRS